MADIQTWVNESAPDLPGASTEGTKQVIRRIFRRFCTESGAFILKQEVPIDIVADQKTYDVRDAYPTLLTDDYVQPMYIWQIGYFMDYAKNPDTSRPLTPVQQPNMRNSPVNPSSQPFGYETFIDKPGIFDLVPPVTKDIPQALSAFVAFRLNATTFPDANIPDVFEYNWFDILLDGIIGSMCAQQEKGYTNAAKAELHQKRFILGMARAREMAKRQFNTADAQFAFPTAGGWIGRR